MGMGIGKMLCLFATRPIADRQFVSEGLSIGLQRNMRQRSGSSRPCARSLQRVLDPLLRKIGKILPHDGMHENPRDTFLRFTYAAQH